MCFCDCLGKGKSIWDVFSHQPGKVDNNDNGNVACDSYHLYRQDVELLQKLKVRMCVNFKKYLISFVKKKFSIAQVFKVILNIFSPPLHG